MNDTPSTAAPTPIRLDKGIGYLDPSLPPADVASYGWNLLREDISLPCAVLYRERLLHNVAWMREFIASYGLRLAPHGKTTMAPKLFAQQLNSGAWGITLATAPQTLVAHAHGVRRVLMANQLVGRENMTIVSRLLRDPGFEFHCLADSPAQVDLLGEFFAATGQRLNVLIELGVTGGRAGVRDRTQLQAVLQAIARSKSSLALSGIEIYEGVLHQEDDVRALSNRAVDIALELAAEGRFARTPFLLSGAGSAWYDVVAQVFSAAGFGDQVEVVLRPGCYLTHDIGIYRDAQTAILQRNPIARRMRSGLLPALHIWAYVQSRPEPRQAIVGMGKRDAAFDAGLPVPALHFRPGKTATKPIAAPPTWTVTRMMDQHAFLSIAEADDLRVGDMIGFDISHPCLTFDKWRSLLLLDPDFQVADIIQTFF